VGKIIECDLVIGDNKHHIEMEIVEFEKVPNSGLNDVKFFIDGFALHSCDFDSIIRVLSLKGQE